MRKHEMQIEIAATPAAVWEALSTGQGIQSWFAPIASVEPGVGGKTYGKWGEGMEGSQRIEIWEPDRRLQVVSERPAPAQPNVVDYFIEGSGGTTVLRLVHSGFGDSADFDAEYESTGTAWPVFLKMMKHSVERGVASCRNVTVFRILQEPSADAWQKLMQHLGGAMPGTVHHYDASGHCSCNESAEDAILSIFCENCGGVTALTVTNLLYDVSPEKADSVREHWSGVLNQVFGAEK